METIQIVPNPVPLPPLGVLLHQFRVGADESVETVSRRGLQEPIEVVRLEVDRTCLGLDDLEHIVDSYRVPRALFPVGRSRVVVDLVAGTVGVEIGESPQGERQEDRILLTYLELLYDARGVAPSHALALTALDTGVLRDVLSSRSDAVQRHLEELLERSADDEPGELRRRLLIAALALLAAGLFFAELRSGERSPTVPTILAEPVWVQAASVSSAPLHRAPVVGSAEVAVDIGEAVVVTPVATDANDPGGVEVGDAVTTTRGAPSP